MPDQWHCVIDGEIVGPLSEEETLRRISLNQIDLDSLVWKKGMSAWAPLRSVPELRAAARAKTNADDAPPPIPPQSSPNFARSQSHGRDYGSSRLETSGPSPYPFAAHKPKRFRFKTWLLLGVSFMLLVGMVSIVDALEELHSKFLFFLGSLSIIALIIVVFPYIYCSLNIPEQSWFIIKGNPRVRLPPIMSWLGLLIPVVNIFWAFVAFWGWARSYNKTLDAFNLSDAPRATEWIFFVLSVSWTISLISMMFSHGSPLTGSADLDVNDLILLMSMTAGYRQMCSAINYFADQAEEETQTGQATE